MYGDMIHKLRKQHGMTRAVLAEYFGVSPTAVYKWENNLSQPDIPTLARMADLFGVTIDHLCDHAPADSGDTPCAEAMVARAKSTLPTFR